MCEYADTKRKLLQQRYDNLRNQQTAYAELLNKLITLPEDESLDMLRRLRESNNADPLPIPAAYLHTDSDASSKADIQEAQNKGLKRKIGQLTQRSDSINGFYGLLQHTSEHGANELFRHIRRGMSPDDVPAFTGQFLSRSPSPNQTNRNILPPTSTSIEFELIALHPNAYPALIPLDVASIDLGLLGTSPFKPDSPLRRSKRGFISEHDQQLLLAPSSAGNQGDLAIGTQRGLSSQYIDARLNHIHIRRWTDVAITDDLAARAISLYLVNDSPWLGCFDNDLFLEDLIHGETRFCSRLLVNAVLSWACVSLINQWSTSCNCLIKLMLFLASICLL